MPLMLRSLTATLLLLAFSTAAQAVVRTVALDGSADFTVIQEALEASTDGDSVLVRPGVYTWTNQGSGDMYGMIRYWLNDQDGVRLISTDGPKVTILDAEGMGRVFFSNGQNFDEVNIYVKGFTLRNGYAPKNPVREEQEGGAMTFHLSHARIIDCIFENNRAEHGGAVWCGGEGSHVFTNCTFIGNRAIKLKDSIDPVGGAMIIIGSTQPMLVEGCTFIDNHSDYLTGGLFTGNSDIVIRDSLFSGNSSPANAAFNRRGTAIYASNSFYVRLEGVTVRDHDSYPGGAIRIAATDVFEMERSNVSHNVSGFPLQVETTNSIDIGCSNLHGGFPGNWVGDITGFRTINGNMQVNPEFCGDTGDLRRVSSSSPMVAANNGCGVDIGRVVGDCFSVPVLAGNLHARRIGDGARLDWEGVDPSAAGLRVERIGPDRRQELDTRRVFGDGARWSLEDAVAPLGRTSYVLLDREGTELARAELPSTFGVRLMKASPNPFNPRTSLSFELASAARVQLEVFDARGRRVATLVDGPQGPGVHEAVFAGVDADGRALGSGVYYLRLKADDQVRTGSMVLVR